MAISIFLQRKIESRKSLLSLRLIRSTSPPLTTSRGTLAVILTTLGYNMGIIILALILMIVLIFIVIKNSNFSYIKKTIIIISIILFFLILISCIVIVVSFDSGLMRKPEELENSSYDSLPKQIQKTDTVY